MENIRKRVDIKLVNDRKQAEKLATKPNFSHLPIFDENLIAIHMKQKKLVFNKPDTLRYGNLGYIQDIDV